MKIWIDITNTPHINVLLPIIRYLRINHNTIITARDFSETVPLLINNGIVHTVIGDYKGKSRVKKLCGMITRTNQLRRVIPDFDISISLGGNYTALVSRLKKRISITFSDNDISFKLPAYKFSNHFIFPAYFNTTQLNIKYGVKDSQINKFEGFKEDIYIADYEPDLNFLKQLPFEKFITIRPENLKASYVPKDTRSIIPELFEKFKYENILFLPRYEEEKEFAKGFKNIFIPDKPLSGLDVCFYTKAMLTGAGTFAREAALLGTPAVSFFPGKTFLTVDKIMQEKGWEYQSRNIDDIYKYVVSANKRPNQINNSKGVQKELFSIIEKIIESV